MLDELLLDSLPVARAFTTGRYAVTIGGSRGKGTSDHRSDVDLRVYVDEFVRNEAWDAAVAGMYALMERWRARGVEIDGIWARTVGEIGACLDKWIGGELAVLPFSWTVWGYHMPTDIFNQVIVEDPYGIAAEWKRRLTPYPEKMRAAIFKTYGERLRYWRADYHYRNKVERGDPTFLAYLTASLVHDVMQLLFALNGVFFPGDGANLKLSDHFAVAPERLVERVTAVLYPGSEQPYELQYERMLSLIDDVLALVAAHAG